ncbi:DUF2490 domain-containing protein [Flavobacterium macrobrachii]|uniref:DUF2490 domain-containing protein n=1 Tax=Flavobacterium macrobrachii TaxID=591204 RepID=A0ABS2CUW7_9FLAO|nr:DUF2490 domain-containing protein [Flavobacterium macrobrachii]MBM6498770.1 DUF2490 domain-containing protein [Flavobacterium macrobrachii]
MKQFYFLTFILLFSFNNLFAQNNRKIERNDISWYNYFGTFKLNEKYSIHSEYQLRRDNFITDKQQSLLRLGVNYQLNPKVQFRLGYAWIETYAYGETPINGMGKDFTEHRTFQMVTLIDKISKIDISHRFMLEQRWVGRYSNIDLSSEDEFPLLNRLRYMIRLQLPLKGDKIENKTPYVAAYNELFIGFGKNVNENIFDQNRIGLLFGYRFNNTLRIEAGYLNQTLQLSREVNNQNVYQNNNGFIVNTNFNFDLSKKKQVKNETI